MYVNRILHPAEMIRHEPWGNNIWVITIVTSGFNDENLQFGISFRETTCNYTSCSAAYTQLACTLFGEIPPTMMMSTSVGVVLPLIMAMEIWEHLNVGL